MYHDLLERLTLILAQTEGWEPEDIHPGNPRMKVYRKMAAFCMGEIDSFLEEQHIEFKDLKVNARYEAPQVLDQEER